MFTSSVGCTPKAKAVEMNGALGKDRLQTISPRFRVRPGDSLQHATREDPPVTQRLGRCSKFHAGPIPGLRIGELPHQVGTHGKERIVMRIEADLQVQQGLPHFLRALYRGQWCNNK